MSSAGVWMEQGLCLGSMYKHSLDFPWFKKTFLVGELTNPPVGLMVNCQVSLMADTQFMFIYFTYAVNSSML